MEYTTSYDEVLDYFGEKVIHDRYEYIYDKIHEYIVVRKLEGRVFIFGELLECAIMDYFTDIFRLKKFHGIARVNDTKRVAYTVFWLARHKVIQISSDSGSVESDLLYINEGFLTIFIAHELLIPNERDTLSGDEQEAFLKLLKHINYHLKYRCIDKQDLELMLLAFEVGRKISV